MDDKRTLLAFLLIGLIFVLSPYYYEWMGMTPKPEGPTQEEAEYVEQEDRVPERIERPLDLGKNQEKGGQKWDSTEEENTR